MEAVVEEYSRGAVEVLSGACGAGLRYVVLAGGDDDDFVTLLQVYRGDRRLTESGFAGPKVHGDAVVNEWRGRSDGLPCFVMARALPVVERIVATTDRGSQVELAMSPVIESFGLRFAAAGLPDGEAPGLLSAYSAAGTVLHTRTQQMPHIGGH